MLHLPNKLLREQFKIAAAEKQSLPFTPIYSM